MGTVYKRKPGAKNYQISWYDENGDRDSRTSGTSDKATAGRILAKIEADVALVKSGVVTASQNLVAKANAKPIGEHLDEYERFSRLTESSRWVDQKIKFLSAFFDHSGTRRLSDLDPDALSLFTASLRDQGSKATFTCSMC